MRRLSSQLLNLARSMLETATDLQQRRLQPIRLRTEYPPARLDFRDERRRRFFRDGGGVVSVICTTRMLVCRQNTAPRIRAIDKLQRSYHVEPTTTCNSL